MPNAVGSTKRDRHGSTYVQVMSPLAKWHRSKPGITERFELFVATKEVRKISSVLDNNGVCMQDCIVGACLTMECEP